MAEQIDVFQFSARKTSETFPNIVILTPNNTLPLTVQNLEEGSVPLVVEYNGDRKVVKRISLSAYNADKILRTVGAFRYRKTETEDAIINSIEDYLEVFEWTY